MLDGVKNGFAIVDKSDDSIAPVFCKNYESALGKNRDKVETFIKSEIEAGRYKIVHETPTIVSALGTIPKTDGGLRVYTDCSKPDGSAVNDHATNLKQSFQTIKDAVGLTTPGCWMVKVDLEAAFRSVASRADQHRFMGLCWLFKGSKTPVFMEDTRLCFGGRKNPGIFNRLTQAVRRFMKRRGFDIVSMLDDMLLICKRFDDCVNGLKVLITLLRDLGFSIAWKKVTEISHVVTFLGVNLDSENMQLSLPDDKVQCIKQIQKL